MATRDYRFAKRHAFVCALLVTIAFVGSLLYQMETRTPDFSVEDAKRSAAQKRLETGIREAEQVGDMALAAKLRELLRGMTTLPSRPGTVLGGDGKPLPTD